MYVLFVDERDGYTVAVGTCRSSDAVHIVFCIVGHVEVYDHSNVVDVDATCHDVCSDEHVDLSALKLVEHLVALCLVEVGVHLTAVDVHAQ